MVVEELDARRSRMKQGNTPGVVNITSMIMGKRDNLLGADEGKRWEKAENTSQITRHNIDNELAKSSRPPSQNHPPSQNSLRPGAQRFGKVLPYGQVKELEKGWTQEQIS